MDPADARRILEEERSRGLDLAGSAASAEDLERAKVMLLGRKSRWSEVQRSLGSLDPEVRRDRGRLSNEVKSSLESAIEERRIALEAAAEERLLLADGVDVSLPGRRPRP